MKEEKITAEALEFILRAAKGAFPDEFSGLLRKNKNGEIAEILIIPQTTRGRNFSSMNLYNIPYTSHHCGSVHSHPSPNPRPSKEDLAFFKATGELHIIAAYPFSPASLRAYDSDGNQIGLKLA